MKRPYKQQYEEGDCFKVNLPKNKSAIGLVARGNSKKGGMLAYFYLDEFVNENLDESIDNLKASDSIAIWKVGDLGMINGEWKVIGKRSKWDRNDFPMPKCVREDVFQPGWGWIVQYSEDDMLESTSETRIELKENMEDFIRDGILGYGLAEELLSDIVDAN
jgi:Immunity protein 26